MRIQESDEQTPWPPLRPARVGPLHAVDLACHAVASFKWSKAMSQAAASPSPSNSPKAGHPLSVAPDERRCRRIIEKDGVSRQCSRWQLPLPDGTADGFCVEHSPSKHAEETRFKRRQAQRA